MRATVYERNVYKKMWVNSQSKFHILKVKSIKAIIFFDLTKNVMAFLLKNCYDRTVFVGFSRKKDAETQK